MQTKIRKSEYFTKKISPLTWLHLLQQSCNTSRTIKKDFILLINSGLQSSYHRFNEKKN